MSINRIAHETLLIKYFFSFLSSNHKKVRIENIHVIFSFWSLSTHLFTNYILHVIKAEFTLFRLSELTCARVVAVFITV